MRNLLACFVLLLLLSTCESTPPAGATAAPEITADTVAKPTPAQALLARAVEAHGGDRYATAHYGFVFRDKQYTFRNDGTRYRYTRTFTDEDGTVTHDVLDNGTLSRTVNEQPVKLSAKDEAKYRNALNSVIYFATLPHKLQDPAVNLVRAGRQTVKEATYDLLRVSFAEEGGGKDFEDNFIYWINQATGRIDYLAYDYRTDGGGVRFRAAYNPRVVDGILFQDYVNYKAPVGTSLDVLAAQYAKGALEELSRIETEEVTVR